MYVTGTNAVPQGVNGPGNNQPRIEKETWTKNI